MPSSRRPRGVRSTQQERSAATLRALLDAATKHLLTGRLEDLVVRDLVEAAGCSTGAFYKRFDDKAALLREVHRGFEAEVTAEAGRLLGAMAGRASVETVARLLVDFGLDLYGRYGGLVRAFTRQAETDRFYRQRASVLLARVGDLVADRLPHEGDAARRETRHNARFAVQVLDACLGQLAGVGAARRDPRFVARMVRVVSAALEGPREVNTRETRR